MHVAISGTHGSGKSTLIGDFAVSHREWELLPDPFEYVDAAEASPGPDAFYRQLRVVVARLGELGARPQLAERSPLDFLAYLHAFDALGRPGEAADFFELGCSLVSRTSARINLLVLLPLNPADAIEVANDEDLELRDAMNLSLLELADDPALVEATRVIEIAGDRDQRLAQLETAIAALSEEYAE